MPTDERVERVARELHAMDHEVSDASRPWEDAHQDAYREMAGRVLRVADAGGVAHEHYGCGCVREVRCLVHCERHPHLGPEGNPGEVFRALRVVSGRCPSCAPQVPDEAVGGLMEGIERTGGGA